MDFALHWKSMEGTNPPTKEKIQAFGFNDISSAMVNMVSTYKMQEAPVGATKNELRDALDENNKKLMEESRKYIDATNKAMAIQMDKVQKAMNTTLLAFQEMQEAFPLRVEGASPNM